VVLQTAVLEAEEEAELQTAAQTAELEAEDGGADG
jgi:hypothetical protein